MKAALHGGELAVGAERFDGVDAPACGGRREREAGQARLIVDQYGASAAFAAVTAGFRSGQPDDFPQIIQQQHVVGNRVGAGAAIERELKNARHAVLWLLFNCAGSIAITGGAFKPGPALGRAPSATGFTSLEIAR